MLEVENRSTAGARNAARNAGDGVVRAAEPCPSSTAAGPGPEAAVPPADIAVPPIDESSGSAASPASGAPDAVAATRPSPYVAFVVPCATVMSTPADVMPSVVLSDST